MPGLSPQAQAKLSTLEGFGLLAQRLYGLIEQYAADRSGGEAQISALKRVVGQLKREFTASGYDAMAQLAGAMEIASHRGTNQQSKARILREGIGSLKSQIEIEQRITRTEGSAGPSEDATPQPPQP